MQKVFNFFKSSFLRSEEKIFGGLRETYGKKWSVGDIIGVFLDTNDKTIGEWTMSRHMTIYKMCPDGNANNKLQDNLGVATRKNIGE